MANAKRKRATKMQMLDRAAAPVDAIAQKPHRAERRLMVVLGIIVFIFAAVFYIPVMVGGEFLNFDDNLNFTNHDAWRGLGWDQLSWMWTTYHMGHWHPLTWMTLGWDHVWAGWVFEDSMDARAYHITNVLLHGVTAVLVFIVGVRIVQAGRIAQHGESQRAGGFAVPLAMALAAIVWAVHPMRVENVAWITERRDLVSAVFLVAAVWAYLRYVQAREAGDAGLQPRARAWWWYGAMVVLFLLSLLGKVMGVTLPLVLLVLDWFPLRRGRGDSAEAMLMAWTRLIFEKLPLFVISAVFAAIPPIMNLKHKWLVGVEMHSYEARIAQSFYGLVYYIWKTIVPTGLLPVHEIRRPMDAFETRFVVAAGIVVVAALLFVAAARRWHWGRATIAAMLVYAVILLPVLGLIAVGPQLVAERYAYLPTMGLAMLLAGGLAWLWSGAASNALKGLAGAGVAAAAIVFGVMTWQYATAWKDSVSLWEYTIARTDQSSFAYNNLGWLQLREVDRMGGEGRQAESLSLLAKAEANVRKAREIEPNNANACFNIGRVHVKRNEMAEAKAMFQESLRLNERLYDAEIELGAVLLQLRENEAAIASLQRGLEANPNNARVHNNLGLVLVRLRRFEEAERHYKQAIVIDPQLHIAWDGLARVYVETNDLVRGREAAEQALKVRPDYQPARSLLELIRQRGG